MRRRRKDGTFQVQVDTGTKDGKRTRKSFYGRTLSEAKAKRDEWLALREAQSKSSVDVNITMKDWSAMWLASVRGLSSNATYNGKVSAVNEQDKVLGDYRVRDITPIVLQRYMSSLDGMSKSTISKRRCIVKAILDSAVLNGIIQTSPYIGVRTPTGTYVGHRCLSEKEIATIMQSTGKYRAAEWAAVMIFTGLRREELCALTSEDVRGGKIYVSKASVLKENGRVKTPKTRAGTRIVPVLSPIEPLLNGIIERRQGLLLFPTTRNKPMNDMSFKRGWESMCKGTGLQFRSHDCRYTYASMLYEAGVDIKTAQYLLGHEDVGVTMNIYTQLSDKKRADGISKLIDYGGKMVVNKGAEQPKN